MTKFGFGDVVDNFELGELPSGKVRNKNGDIDTSIIKDAEKLGFTDRSGLKNSKRRKPGRKKATYSRSQVLIAGPADVVDNFKKYCIENGDIPYWEGLRYLLDRQT